MRGRITCVWAWAALNVGHACTCYRIEFDRNTECGHTKNLPQEKRSVFIYYFRF
jgi:hypothetical protein